MDHQIMAYRLSDYSKALMVLLSAVHLKCVKLRGEKKELLGQVQDLVISTQKAKACVVAMLVVLLRWKCPQSPLKISQC